MLKLMSVRWLLLLVKKQNHIMKKITGIGQDNKTLCFRHRTLNTLYICLAAVWLCICCIPDIIAITCLPRSRNNVYLNIILVPGTYRKVVLQPRAQYYLYYITYFILYIFVYNISNNVILKFASFCEKDTHGGGVHCVCAVPCVPIRKLYRRRR